MLSATASSWADDGGGLTSTAANSRQRKTRDGANRLEHTMQLAVTPTHISTRLLPRQLQEGSTETPKLPTTRG